MATTLTNWTIADLAEYCEHCMVIAVQDNEKYCDGCADEITEYLAQRFCEQESVEKGLY
jgi:hypothetical protein